MLETDDNKALIICENELLRLGFTDKEISELNGIIKIIIEQILDDIFKQ